MINYFQLKEKNKRFESLLFHIQFNILFYLKKDKSFKRIKRLDVNFEIDESTSKFEIIKIQGNNNQICVLDVKTSSQCFKSPVNTGLLVCEILERLYSLNSWDKTIVIEMKEKFLKNEYLVNYSLFKNKNVQDKFEIEVFKRFQLSTIEYMVKKTSKLKTEEKVFFVAKQNPLMSNYLFYSFDMDNHYLKIYDMYKEIVSKINVLNMEFQIEYCTVNPNFEVLKNFVEYLRIDCDSQKLSTAFIEYMNK